MDKKHLDKLITVLHDVGVLKNIECDFRYDCGNDQELCYRGEGINWYLATMVLGELIDKGIITITVNDKEHERYKYLLKLLGDKDKK